MSTYTEDHLVEQPAIQLMRHELGWEVVNCYDEPSTLKLRRSGWNGGVSHQGRDGKREGVEILNVGCWILNGRGRREAVPRLNSVLSVAAGLICWPVKFLDTRRAPHAP